MYNFKFNVLSRGQLESLSLDRIFLPLFKILPCYEGFLVTYFLPLLLEYCAEIILIPELYSTRSNRRFAQLMASFDYNYQNPSLVLFLMLIRAIVI